MNEVVAVQENCQIFKPGIIHLPNLTGEVDFDYLLVSKTKNNVKFWKQKKYPQKHMSLPCSDKYVIFRRRVSKNHVSASGNESR